MAIRNSLTQFFDQLYFETQLHKKKKHMQLLWKKYRKV